MIYLFIVVLAAHNIWLQMQMDKTKILVTFLIKWIYEDEDNDT